MKDNIIEEKEDYEAIGLHGFYYKLFEEWDCGGGSIGIRRVSLFDASISVLAGRLGQAYGKNKSSGW